MAGMLWACAFGALAANTVDVAPFIKRDGFQQLKISPHGEYYAASALMDDRSALVVIRRADNKPVAHFNLGANKYVNGFWWVTPTKVMVTMAEKIGALENPAPTANLYTVDAGTGGVDILVGQDVQAMSTGTHIETKKQEYVAAELIGPIPGDPDDVLVLITPFNTNPYDVVNNTAGNLSRVDRMNVNSGKRVTVVRAPVHNVRFLLDHHGAVRMAHGWDMSGDHKLFYRAGDGADWRELNDERASGHDEIPLGFSADDRTAYLQVEQADGPDAIVAMDLATGKRTKLFQDDDSDPFFVIEDQAHAPVGVGLMDGKPRTVFFAGDGSEERLYRSLEGAFAGSAVEVTSTTDDGRLALVEVSSDRNPGDFYLFDTVSKKAALVLSRRDWLDPEKMSEKRPFAFKARDGMLLHGYVTLPAGAGDKRLPMVVLPHGGPFGVAEEWTFDDETQMLAAAGYAVLQLDYRGSGNHGRAYQQAGARDWGGRMQDDLTDATRWVFDQGIADPQRMCIYGASYGAYAALMGAAREPSLYRCAAGYVGVYDLPLLVSSATAGGSSGKAWRREWIGEAAALGERSPTTLASRIKVPGFLARSAERR
ncbi:MAG: S9 family peptidase, partial [Lysobacter sp.]|nr:S9 family peptidase [Lysobacter sp.]